LLNQLFLLKLNTHSAYSTGYLSHSKENGKAENTAAESIYGMLLGLHSLLSQTKVKAAAASMSINFALFVSDSFHSPTDSAGQAAQQLSFESY